ncbi:hypothetical protein C8R44DRAFT_745394 [Mycena epipterygia]|nr:hypothetical protein C8R44DRAFT_745394 [Mycena epipterygia]
MCPMKQDILISGGPAACSGREFGYEAEFEVQKAVCGRAHGRRRGGREGAVEAAGGRSGQGQQEWGRRRTWSNVPRYFMHCKEAALTRCARESGGASPPPPRTGAGGRREGGGTRCGRVEGWETERLWKQSKPGACKREGRAVRQTRDPTQKEAAAGESRMRWVDPHYRYKVVHYYAVERAGRARKGVAMRGRKQGRDWH